MTGLQQSGLKATGLMYCTSNPSFWSDPPTNTPSFVPNHFLMSASELKLHTSQTFKNRGGATTEVFYIGAPMSHQAQRALDFLNLLYILYHSHAKSIQCVRTIFI
jgi:hypothetical protein